jgi:DNA helicase HerA-like ATPase
MALAVDHRVAWSDFLAHFDWRQGEHLSVLGHTGRGKTHLVRQLLPRRRHVIVVAVKPKDPLLDQFKADGYALARDWPPPRPSSIDRRVLLWPDLKKGDAHVGDVIGRCLEDVYSRGRFCVFTDDCGRLCEDYGQARRMRKLWTDGRSLGVSLVAATQRPAWVPRHMYSAPMHLFFFASSDHDDLKRISGLGGMDSKRIRATVSELDPEAHEVAYVDVQHRRCIVTKVEV